MLQFLSSLQATAVTPLAAAGAAVVVVAGTVIAVSPFLESQTPINADGTLEDGLYCANTESFAQNPSIKNLRFVGGYELVLVDNGEPRISGIFIGKGDLDRCNRGFR